jgi:DNA-binding MarR family transcriptional regulator
MVFDMPDHASDSHSSAKQNGSYPDVEALLAEVNALSIRLNQVGRGQGSAGGLPTAAYGVLQALERHGPQTVPQIARRRSTSRQNIQILINRLQSQSCVELTSNPAHRRSALVTLTLQGRTLLTQGAEVYGKMLETLAGNISALELTGATRLLNGIRRLLSAQKTPTADLLHPRKTSRPRRKRPQPAVPAKEIPTAPEPAPARPVAENISPNEDEFPVNLL